MSGEPAIMNSAFDNALSLCSSKEDREEVMRVWILLGIQYLTKSAGKERTQAFLLNLAGHLDEDDEEEAVALQ
jgi:hypothetical protein